MVFTCFVLSKGFSSYTYIKHFEVEEKNGQLQTNITETAQVAVQLYYEWDLGTNPEVKLYLTDEPLGDRKERGPLLKIVNDNYLLENCREVQETDLRNVGRVTERSLIAVGAGAMVEFLVCMRAGYANAPLTCLRGNLSAPPSTIVDLVRKQARKIAKNVEFIDESDISFDLVYQAREPMEDFLEDFQRKVEAETWRDYAIPFSDVEGGNVPRGDGCFFVELVTRGYDYVLFREQDSEYTFIENETAFLLPRRSFEDLESVARHRIETISDLDVETGLRISVWEPKGKLKARSLKEWSIIQLTAENFGKDLTQCSRNRALAGLKQILVVVFHQRISLRKFTPTY